MKSQPEARAERSGGAPEGEEPKREPQAEQKRAAEAERPGGTWKSREGRDPKRHA